MKNNVEQVEFKKYNDEIKKDVLFVDVINPHPLTTTTNKTEEQLMVIDWENRVCYS